jgi:hypothetical protein
MTDKKYRSITFYPTPRVADWYDSLKSGEGSARINDLLEASLSTSYAGPPGHITVRVSEIENKLCNLERIASFGGLSGTTLLEVQSRIGSEFWKTVLGATPDALTGQSFGGPVDCHREAFPCVKEIQPQNLFITDVTDDHELLNAYATRSLATEFESSALKRAP